MRTVVVTGVSGKSGRFFLQRLISEHENLTDYRFKFLCRFQGKSPKQREGYELLQKAVSDGRINAEICAVNLRDSAQVKAVFSEPVYMLFHIASIKLTMDVVPVALESGVDNIVMVHTTGIYSKYKAAGEEYRKIEAHIQTLVEGYRDQGREVATTILRPTMIYGDLEDGNLSKFIKMVDKLRLFPTVSGGRYELQPVWCKDLGDAYYEVMTKWEITKNKEYILSGGKPILLREMFQEIARQLGVKNVFLSCPFPIAYFGAWLVYLCTFTKVDYREKVQRMVEPRAYSHELAAHDFGYAPKEFAEGIREEIEAYKNSKKNK